IAVALGALALAGAPAEPLARPRPAPAVAPAFDTSKIEAAADKLVSDVRSWGGSAGVAVVEGERGTLLIARNEHGLLNPASNAKLVTAAAALKVLGPAHRYATGLYGKIHGDAVDELVVRGDGDPGLSTEDLASLGRDLKAMGVRHVHALFVDQS